jgi:hypothetical protein
LQTDLQGFLAFDAIKKEKTPYGQKYEIRSVLTGSNGKSINLVTAWKAHVTFQQSSQLTFTTHHFTTLHHSQTSTLFYE